MLAISAQNQQGIFEKVLRGKDGRLYTVRFLVLGATEQARVRILSAILVPTLDGDCQKHGKVSRLLLHGDTSNAEEFLNLDSQPFISPFVSRLEFFVSQMTRAPSSF